MYLSLSNDSFAWYLNNATCISEVNLLYSYKNASLAQRLEHRICNARVVGSIPTGGLYFNIQYFKLVNYEYSFFFVLCFGRLRDGQQPSKLFCVGSNPIRNGYLLFWCHNIVTPLYMTNCLN